MFKAGLTPLSFAPLSADERQRAQDASAKLMAIKLDDQELEQLQLGSITLNELGITSDLQLNIEDNLGKCLPSLNVNGNNNE
jgi:hypothetical protein